MNHGASNPIAGRAECAGCGWDWPPGRAPTVDDRCPKCGGSIWRDLTTGRPTEPIAPAAKEQAVSGRKAKGICRVPECRNQASHRGVCQQCKKRLAGGEAIIAGYQLPSRTSGKLVNQQAGGRRLGRLLDLPADRLEELAALRRELDQVNAGLDTERQRHEETVLPLIDRRAEIEEEITAIVAEATGK